MWKNIYCMENLHCIYRVSWLIFDYLPFNYGIANNESKDGFIIGIFCYDKNEKMLCRKLALYI